MGNKIKSPSYEMGNKIKSNSCEMGNKIKSPSFKRGLGGVYHKIIFSQGSGVINSKHEKYKK
jgi:hypothetical protein